MDVQVAGSILREMEHSRTALLPEWLGQDLVQFMSRIGALIVSMGGLPLPKLPSLYQEQKNGLPN
jgi:hypothetical protein